MKTCHWGLRPAPACAGSPEAGPGELDEARHGRAKTPAASPAPRRARVVSVAMRALRSAMGSRAARGRLAWARAVSTSPR